MGGDSSGKITSAHQAIAKAIRQTKDARSGMVQLSNTFAKASYQFENDQVAQGLLKLSAKLNPRRDMHASPPAMKSGCRQQLVQWVSTYFFMAPPARHACFFWQWCLLR